MHQPKITVVIPTRERCDVLEKALLTVTSQKYDNLEILVSDNFSQDRTRQVVEAAGDPRVRYLNVGRRVSMSHNWEFALSHVTDGWVTIIGDDDGLLPGSLLKVSDVIRSTGVKAIRSKVCEYAWPSLTGKPFGQLQVPLSSGYERRHARTWLARVLNGRASYTALPMLYNGGYVDVRTLEEIRRRTGRLYRSCIPDVYSGVSIASTIDDYIFLHEPLAINGASRHSTGTSQFALKKPADATPASVFASEGNIPFHEDLPLCADGSYPSSLQALMYESYLQSRDLRDQTWRHTHAEQLEIILANAGGHAAAIADWGRAFASKHALDFDAIQSRAQRRALRHKLRTIGLQVNATLNYCRLGSADCPVEDVYAASLAAMRVRQRPPSRWSNVPRLLDRAFNKLALR
jgi:hypothetical protein